LTNVYNSCTIPPVNKERIMAVKFYDLEADEKQRLEDAEARHLAYRTSRMIEEIRDGVLTMDAMMIGVLLGDGHGK